MVKFGDSLALNLCDEPREDGVMKFDDLKESVKSGIIMIRKDRVRGI